MKPYLALFRAGPSSLHPKAIERLDAQNFDYALSWFGDDEPLAPGAVFVHRQKGAKWPGLEQTLVRHWDQISQYRHIWLPDDDLLCVPEQISRMFSICDDLQLDLAQPALTIDSYFTHLVTLRHSEFQLRFTNFVEIMAPVFSADMLARVFPSLKGNISGYGLDNVWPRLSQLGKVAIIDDTPVKHTRPVGGPNYQFNVKAGLSPMQEDWLSSATHFVDQPSDYHLNYGGLLQDGGTICLGSSGIEIEKMLIRLIGSTQGMSISATQMTRYLANHLDYARAGEAGAARYPRAVLRIVLNRGLQDTGLHFAEPGGPPSAPAAPSSATSATAAGTAATATH